MSKGPVTTRPSAAWTAAAAWSAEVTSQFGSYPCRVVRTNLRVATGQCQTGLADVIVAPPQLVAEGIAVEAQARVKIWHRDGDRVDHVEQGSR